MKQNPVLKYVLPIALIFILLLSGCAAGSTAPQATAAPAQADQPTPASTNPVSAPAASTSASAATPQPPDYSLIPVNSMNTGDMTVLGISCKVGFYGTPGAAPKTIAEAAKILKVDEKSLTPLNACADSSVVIGYVVGYSTYTQMVTTTLPAGVTVDYATSTAKRSSGLKFAWRVEYQDTDKTRGQVSTSSTIEAFKLTVYWTPGKPADDKNTKLTLVEGAVQP
jgi:hypothetical protein